MHLRRALDRMRAELDKSEWEICILEDETGGFGDRRRWKRVVNDSPKSLSKASSILD